MKKWLLLLLGLLLIVILSFFCFKGKKESIKNHLTNRVHQAYQAKGIEGVDASLEGEGLKLTRNVLLTGVVANAEAKEEAGRIASEIEGVALVDNQLKIATAQPATPVSEVVEATTTPTPVEETTVVVTETVAAIPSPYVILAIKDKSKHITLRGYVKDSDEHQTIVARANSLFGTENVTDELQEANGTPTAWEESSLLGLDKLAMVDYGEFNISNSDFNFKGYVAEEATKEKILTALTDNLNTNYTGTYNVTAPKVEVAVISPYVISAIKDKSKHITLRGYVKDSDEHQTIVARANSLFGTENVTDELQEANGTPTAWEESSLLGLDKLAMVDYGEFNISDSNFNFKGYVAEEATKEKMVSTMKENLNSYYVGNYDIEYPKVVTPTPVVVSVATCQEKFKELLSKEKIHFEYDRAVIKKDSYDLLNNLIEIANECSDAKITIEGHTDSDGSRAYNQKLSYKRANAVKNYLVQQGVDESRLKAVGYGEMRPIATNKTAKGKEQNRRIEFKLEGVK